MLSPLKAAILDIERHRNNVWTCFFQQKIINQAALWTNSCKEPGKAEGEVFEQESMKHLMWPHHPLLLTYPWLSELDKHLPVRCNMCDSNPPQKNHVTLAELLCGLHCFLYGSLRVWPASKVRVISLSKCSCLVGEVHFHGVQTISIFSLQSLSYTKRAWWEWMDKELGFCEICKSDD